MSFEPIQMSTGDVSNGTLSRDALFDVLAHEYRRFVLTYLFESSRSATVDDLASHVVSSVESSEEDMRTRVTILLHHSHLPKMDEAGLLNYEQDQRTVSLTDAGSDLLSSITTT